jgi:hypothetical protein
MGNDNEIKLAKKYANKPGHLGAETSEQPVPTTQLKYNKFWSFSQYRLANDPSLPLPSCVSMGYHSRGESDKG